MPKIRYLYKWCNKAGCTKSINAPAARCGIKDRLAKNCPHKDNHIYVSRINIPGTNTPQIRHHSKDYEESLKAHLEFKAFLERNNWQKVERKRKKPKPRLLKDVMAMRIDYLSDIDLTLGRPHKVPERRQLKLSKKHINTCARYLDYFMQAVREAGYSTSAMLFSSIGEREADIFINWIEAQVNPNGSKRFGEVSYNLILKNMMAFLGWMARYGYKITNPFEEERLKIVPRDPKVITSEELDTFFAAITPENAWQTVGNVRYNRLYDWFISACFFALYTGERYDGIFYARWSDIDKNFFNALNWKTYRRTKGKVKIYSYIPISSDLAKLLDDLGYSKYIGTDRYILAPDNPSRETLKDRCGKAFTHFWGKAGLPKGKTFRNFRKTFSTRVRAKYGYLAGAMKKWSREDTEIQHYLDKQELQKEMINNELFPDVPRLKK